MDVQELIEASKSLQVAMWQLEGCDFDLTEDEQQALYKAQAPIHDALNEIHDLITKYK